MASDGNTVPAMLKLLEQREYIRRVRCKIDRRAASAFNCGGDGRMGGRHEFSQFSMLHRTRLGACGQSPVAKIY
ncbi:hypothetical protein [Novipirellula galeiformis]|uniref:hypothetical protein n=1 Tax=Novipirellula galeiformis TaxID=2528004 RepID=UPI0036F24024